MEEWKQVKGYEGIYEVNTNGVVRTIERTIKMKVEDNWTRMHPVKGKVKTPRKGTNGYLTVALSLNSKTHNIYLHRIIAVAFLPPIDKCNVVNHKNGIKTDNRIENLEWCTSGYNNYHAIHSRLRRPAHASLTEKEAIQIKEMRRQGLTIVKISEIIKHSKYVVGEYLRGKSYKWLKV